MALLSGTAEVGKKQSKISPNLWFFHPMFTSLAQIWQMVWFLEPKEPFVNEAVSITAKDPFVFGCDFFFQVKKSWLNLSHYLYTLALIEHCWAIKTWCDKSPGMAWLALTLVAAAQAALLLQLCSVPCLFGNLGQGRAWGVEEKHWCCWGTVCAGAMSVLELLNLILPRKGNQ